MSAAAKELMKNKNHLHGNKLHKFGIAAHARMSQAKHCEK